MPKATPSEAPSEAPKVPSMTIEESTQPLPGKPAAAPHVASKPVKVEEVNGMKIEDF